MRGLVRLLHQVVHSTTITEARVRWDSRNRANPILRTAKVYPARIRPASAPAFRNGRKRSRRCFRPVARFAAKERVENKGVLQCSWHSACLAIDARVWSALAWTCRNNDARHGLRERPPKSNFQTRGVA